MSTTPDKDQMALIYSYLKRAFRLSDLRRQAMKRVEVRVRGTNKDGSVAARDSVFYKCENCGVLCKAQPSPNYPRIQIDHISSVIPVDRAIDSYDDLINRLFCSLDNLQALCMGCHKVKSVAENAKRRLFKKTVSSAS